MGLVAVIIAALAGFAVGAVWYIVLSRPWMAAAGIRMHADGKPDGNGSAMPFLVSGIAMLVVAGFMRHVFTMSGIDTPGEGLVAGLGVGLFFITPWLAMDYAYAGRPARLTLIDGGYATLGCGAIGLVLTLF
jgi:hypothetical protein